MNTLRLLLIAGLFGFVMEQCANAQPWKDEPELLSDAVIQLAHEITELRHRVEALERGN